MFVHAYRTVGQEIQVPAYSEMCLPMADGWMELEFGYSTAEKLAKLCSRALCQNSQLPLNTEVLRVKLETFAVA